MVQIKIKGINNQYHIQATFDNFDMFLTELIKRLDQCLRVRKQGFQAFFHIPPISDEQMMKLFQVCTHLRTLILGFDYEQKKQEYKLWEKDFYNGQDYMITETMMVLGNVQKQAILTTTHDMYVMGSVLGTVDLVYQDCVLCASKIDANIRICDTQFQNLTSFSPVKVYYDKGKLKMKEYEEERVWEKQSQ